MTLSPLPVLLASSNRHKLNELQEMLAPRGIPVLSPSDLGIDLEVEETGDTFAENAVLKAEAYARASGLLSLADDSGLVVEALGGEPGVRSARYGGPGLDDMDRLRLVLERLEGVDEGRRGAAFVSVIALAGPGRMTETFEGRAEGRLLREPRGTGGFGYDPIFYFPALCATFAEIPSSVKSSVSHRGAALRAALPAIVEAAEAGILGDGGRGTQ